MANKVKKAKKEGPSAEIRRLADDGKLIIGERNTIKALKTGKVSMVFITSNCPSSLKEDISHYAELSKAEIVELGIPNDEMGIVCKKPFSISIVGVKK